MVRPQEFDEAQVVEAATEVFWRHGIVEEMRLAA
jgi:hypothetical protein